MNTRQLESSMMRIVCRPELEVTPPSDALSDYIRPDVVETRRIGADLR